ncbi:LysM peptidoglycan-binding domain-containing protein [Sporosarcina gallistercoris]|uniref:LysM peptidoglycan-binding domain-containing protein n=1 Tax=Sporosarcina gallistercoris TaxID=2762245 RepID=UPI003D26B92D
MGAGVYLSAKNDTEGFRLPINPEEINVKRAGAGESFKIAKLGSVNVPKDPELQEFELESFFPARETHYSNVDFQEPQSYIDKLNRWLESQEPIRYIYVNGSFSVNEMVTIENFEYCESYGTEDVDYELELMKYVDFGPKQLKIEKPKPDKKAPPKVTASKKPSRQTKKLIPQTYSLVKGDSLWKVTQKYTGNGANYKKLQTLNGIRDSQIRKLPIGLKLKIPAEWIK